MILHHEVYLHVVHALDKVRACFFLAQFGSSEPHSKKIYTRRKCIVGLEAVMGVRADAAGLNVPMLDPANA